MVCTLFFYFIIVALYIANKKRSDTEKRKANFTPHVLENTWFTTLYKMPSAKQNKRYFKPCFNTTWFITNMNVGLFN
jgi:hypothetical protein